jgi:hypothetical protein
MYNTIYSIKGISDLTTQIKDLILLKNYKLKAQKGMLFINIKLKFAFFFCHGNFESILSSNFWW